MLISFKRVFFYENEEFPSNLKFLETWYLEKLTDFPVSLGTILDIIFERANILIKLDSFQVI